MKLAEEHNYRDASRIVIFGGSTVLHLIELHRYYWADNTYHCIATEKLPKNWTVQPWIMT